MIDVPKNNLFLNFSAFLFVFGKKYFYIIIKTKTFSEINDVFYFKSMVDEGEQFFSEFYPLKITIWYIKKIFFGILNIKNTELHISIKNCAFLLIFASFLILSDFFRKILS